jgi:HEAT repeat protein
MADTIKDIFLLIGELDTLTKGEEAAARLVECGSLALTSLRTFLLEGRPRKIFQPRRWAVEALARLRAKDILLDYLFMIKNIADPEDRFGEEAVESAAARSLAAWPSEKMFRSLLKLSERRMLTGLIEALAEYKRPDAMPYFERALEDDYYRAAAEKAFEKLGVVSRDILVRSAVSPRPGLSEETPSSLRRRRSAVSILSEIGILAEHWQILRRLIKESDEELVITASKLGIGFVSKKDRVIIARRMKELESMTPWRLKEDIENILTALGDESALEIKD